MKKLLLVNLTLILSLTSLAQSQIITTGNNVINTSSPGTADVVIGSSLNGGSRHDASIMWWSNASASRISNTSDVFNFSVWNTNNPNVSLAAAVGQPSYFQGNVGIGTTNPDEKLTVYGTVHARAVKVDLNGPLADFVFDRGYHLAPLTQVNSYINKYHHLSEMPTAAEAAAKGLDLGLMNQKLLQKVEELTLYVIQQDERIKKLETARHARHAKAAVKTSN